MLTPTTKRPLGIDHDETSWSEAYRCLERSCLLQIIFQQGDLTIMGGHYG